MDFKPFRIGKIEITEHFQIQYYNRVLYKNEDNEKEVIKKIRDDILKNSYIASYKDGKDYGFYVPKKGIFFPIKGEENDRHLRTVLYASNDNKIKKLYDREEFLDNVYD